MTGDVTPQRQQAHLTFVHAVELAQKGHYERAVERGEEALEYDPAYLDCRRWLAKTYEAMQEPVRASHHLQEIVHLNHDDGEAWADLERVDPKAASRLRRVSEIGPDPFVAARQQAKAALDDLDDMDSVGEDEEATAAERAYLDYATHTTVSRDEAASMLVEDDAIAPTEPSAQAPPPSSAAGAPMDTVPQAPPPSSAPVGPSAVEDDPIDMVGTGASPNPGPETVAIGPQPWEHEQDRPYRERFLRNPLLGEVVARIEESWKDPNHWQPVLADCAHASKKGQAVLYDASAAAVRALHAPTPILLVAPESVPHSGPLRASEVEVALNTCLLRCLAPAQLVFAVGRTLAYILTGNAPLLHATVMAADRPSKAMGFCEEAAKEYVWDMAGGWFESHPKEDKQKAAALAHAWHQRCELSCDRAGLLACGDIEAACDAVAKMAQRTAQQAATTSWRAFAEQFRGTDPAELAAIPPKDDPRYSQTYAVYRIRTLRWWFKTDEYKGLAQTFRAE